MTVAAKRQSTTRQAPPDDEACLVEANVNPRTGFATDYLNHFNETIMLLELMAECRNAGRIFSPGTRKNTTSISLPRNPNIGMSQSPPMTRPILRCASSSIRWRTR